jgi:hypothetical protein
MSEEANNLTNALNVQDLIVLAEHLFEEISLAEPVE